MFLSLLFLLPRSLVWFIFYAHDAVVFRTQTRNLYSDDNFARATLEQTAIISGDIFFCSYFCHILSFFLIKNYKWLPFFLLLACDICFCRTKIIAFQMGISGLHICVCGYDRASKHWISYICDTFYACNVEFVGYKCT